MYTIETSTFWQGTSSFFELLGGALRLDPAAFRAVQTDANANLLLLLLLLLAGASQMLGQSVVLLANKVTPRRFVMSVLLNAVLFVVGVLIWAAVFQMVGRFVLGVQLPFVQMGRVVSLAYAPLILGFLVLLPYAGSFLGHVLDAWSTLAMLVALNVTLHLDFWQALFCALLGWAIILALQYTIGRPIVALQRWLRHAVAGVPLSTRVQELVKGPAEQSMEPPKGEHS
jgi:Yip1 domain